MPFAPYTEARCKEIILQESKSDERMPSIDGAKKSRASYSVDPLNTSGSMYTDLRSDKVVSQIGTRQPLMHMSSIAEASPRSAAKSVLGGTREFRKRK